MQMELTYLFEARMRAFRLCSELQFTMKILWLNEQRNYYDAPNQNENHRHSRRDE